VTELPTSDTCRQARRWGARRRSRRYLCNLWSTGPRCRAGICRGARALSQWRYVSQLPVCDRHKAHTQAAKPKGCHKQVLGTVRRRGPPALGVDGCLKQNKVGPTLYLTISHPLVGARIPELINLSLPQEVNLLAKTSVTVFEDQPTQPMLLEGKKTGDRDRPLRSETRWPPSYRAES
jgi:hypothetical protein